jgi:transcriptional regulator with XRE-family HTH domain
VKTSRKKVRKPLPRGNWDNVYARARLKSGLSQEDVVEKLFIPINKLSAIENWRITPEPELVMALENLYEKPLHKSFCRQGCIIGRKTKMVPINYNLEKAIPRLSMQLLELHTIANQLPVYKETKDDLTPEEWRLFLEYARKVDKVQRDVEVLNAYLDRLIEEKEIAGDKKRAACAAKR